MGNALANFVQKRDLFLSILPFLCLEFHVNILNAVKTFSDPRQVLIMRNEERQTPCLGNDMLQHGLGNSGAVMSAGASAQFIENDKTSGTSRA
ncbi:hypothetical protein HG531_011977 [Fusarium graminearum]|nr:hypothetical protein HG531_011977 [Fusarium graminearum]